MKHVLITGASGFIGRHLCHALVQQGYTVRAMVRKRATPPTHTDAYIIEDLATFQNWAQALEGIDTVIYLAGIAHTRGPLSTSANLLKYNVAPIQGLLRALPTSHVTRIVYLSSAKAMGNETPLNAPFTAASSLNPLDPYGQAKAKVETLLRDAAPNKSVILRPPLVYGPGVKANFYKLLSLCDRGTPLPFKSLHNQRSIIYVENLIAAIIAAATHDAAVGKTYLVRDTGDVSTPQLISYIRWLLEQPTRLYPCPPFLLRLAGHYLNISLLPLVNSLVLDDCAIRRDLHFSPPFTTQEGLEKTVAWYLLNKMVI